MKTEVLLHSIGKISYELIAEEETRLDEIECAGCLPGAGPLRRRRRKRHPKQCSGRNLYNGR